MRVNVTVSVEVDAQEWADEYGLDKSHTRNDVRAFLSTALQEIHPLLICEVKQ